MQGGSGRSGGLLALRRVSHTRRQLFAIAPGVFVVSGDEALTAGLGSWTSDFEAHKAMPVE